MLLQRPTRRDDDQPPPRKPAAVPFPTSAYTAFQNARVAQLVNGLGPVLEGAKYPDSIAAQRLRQIATYMAQHRVDEATAAEAIAKE